MVALARGRRAGLILLTTGAVMLVLLLGGWRSFGVVLGPTLFAIALMVLGAVCTSILRRLEISMRGSAHAHDPTDPAVPNRRQIDRPGRSPARIRPSETNGDVSLPRFTSARSWFALSHRVEPRPMSRYETAVVTPLAINGDAELALRRFSPLVRSGTTVGALSAFRELAAIELPDIDVDRVTCPLSPAWVKLPLDAFASMTSGTADEGLDVDTLVEADDDATWPFLPGAALIWIADDLDDEGW